MSVFYVHYSCRPPSRKDILFTPNFFPKRFLEDLFCYLVIKSQGHGKDAFNDSLTSGIVKFYFLVRRC